MKLYLHEIEAFLTEMDCDCCSCTHLRYIANDSKGCPCDRKSMSWCIDCIIKYSGICACSCGPKVQEKLSTIAEEEYLTDQEMELHGMPDEEEEF